MDRASFELLFCPEILVGVSCQANAVSANARTDVQPHNRIAATTSLFPSLAVKTDGGSRGFGFLRPFSCLHAGQECAGKKSNLFFGPIINLVIPIALVVAVARPIKGIFFVLRRCLRFVRCLIAHVVNDMSGVTQSAGNISQARGNLTQVFGRSSHV